ncbi:MAG: TRC40/GET3/ArsA family transport-energizing ATPase, partial [Eubacteriales bacterium]|nr:TRC40/GET3/ArsA family transport-energizing ATPase [Eubacteriales bacterium]
MSAPDYLSDPSLRLILFGGKGGVGKTTMACASALHLALVHPGQKVLLISTDPAHSLADCLGLPIGDQISPIHYRPTAFNAGAPISDLGFQASDSPNLFAWEPDTGRLAEEFKTQHRDALKKLADRGTYFDETDIARFLDLSIPGMDEVMAILEISRLMAEGAYDRLIVDTAPTGHTIRMLGLPEQMLLWVKSLDLMQEKHRVMASRFNRGRVVKDECDAFIKKLSSDLATVKKLFADREKTRFVPVTLPEPMVIDETLRLAARLKALSVPVHEILVNRVVLAQNCPFCRSRSEDQAVYLKMLERELVPCTLFPIPLFSMEIEGVAGLQELGQVLWGGKKIPPGQPGVPIASPSPAALSFKETPELILVGGKVGVGKTSVASAIALHLARTDPSRKV